MHQARTVHLHLDREHFNLSREAEKAIGYLATWAHYGDTGKYAGDVNITNDRDGNLHATYRRQEDDKTTFQIFAQQQEDGSFSYHS